jgi:hypothetical protein
MTTPLTKAEAQARFRTLVAQYGLKWTAAVPATAHEALREINAVLTAADRREALRPRPTYRDEGQTPRGRHALPGVWER